MPSLAERQAEFVAALLDPTLPAPSGLAGPPGSVRVERFAVYRNNVAVGLIEALRSGFPVVNRLVGEEFFTAMARLHALRCPPSSPVLLAYGGDFPAFIAEFEPAATLPYLADVARFEWLWLEAFHAADADPLAIEDLRRVPVDRLPGLRLCLHPSTRIVELAHPALAIWRAHQDDGEPTPIEPARGRSRCCSSVRRRKSKPSPWPQPRWHFWKSSCGAAPSGTP
ncbi:MAG: DNA-binding domain-containing protein [Aliidongia sp.]